MAENICDISKEIVRANDLVKPRNTQSLTSQQGILHS